MLPRPLKRPENNDLLLDIFSENIVLFFLGALGAIVPWCHRGAIFTMRKRTPSLSDWNKAFASLAITLLRLLGLLRLLLGLLRLLLGLLRLLLGLVRVSIPSQRVRTADAARKHGAGQ